VTSAAAGPDHLTPSAAGRSAPPGLYRAVPSINHLGVEVPDVDTVDREQGRLAEAGLASIEERGTTCCYAKQDKLWVQGAPDGER
jgi:hypothetical protein